MNLWESTASASLNGRSTSGITRSGTSDRLEEDQEASPSKFIWLEDGASRNAQYDEDGTFLGHFVKASTTTDENDRTIFPIHYSYTTIIPPSRYTYVVPDPFEGLIQEDFKNIDEWIDKYRNVV